MVDVMFYPAHAQIDRLENSVTLCLPGVFQALFYDEDGELRCESTTCESEMAIPIAESADLNANVYANGKPLVSSGMNGMLLRGDVSVEIITSSGQGIPVVAEVELGELQKPKPDRPSLILCRKGSQRLWDIAKNTGSTVEAILEANNLQGEPNAEQVLLIPVL
jgi:hypothetical protein